MQQQQPAPPQVEVDPVAAARSLSRATLLKLALQLPAGEDDEDTPTLPGKSTEYDIHRNGEPWHVASRRVSVRGFVKPSQQERNADGTALLGRTVFVDKIGEGMVVGFKQNRTGPSSHIIEFNPSRGGEQHVKLRRKGNTETEWLVLSAEAEERAKRSWRGKEETYRRMLAASRKKKPGVEDRMTPQELEQREKEAAAQAIKDARNADRRAQLVAHWKQHNLSQTKHTVASKDRWAPTSDGRSPSSQKVEGGPTLDENSAKWDVELTQQPAQAVAKRVQLPPPGTGAAGVDAKSGVPAPQPEKVRPVAAGSSFEGPRDSVAAKSEVPAPQPEEVRPDAAGSSFKGPRDGYMFTTRDGQTGYWPDRHAANRPTEGAGGRAAMDAVDADRVSRYWAPPHAAQEQAQEQERTDVQDTGYGFEPVAAGDGASLTPAPDVVLRLLRTASAVQEAGVLMLQQFTHQERNSIDATEMAEQMRRLASLQTLWERISVPERMELSAVAARKQMQYEGILELKEALGQHLLEAEQMPGWLDGGSVAAEGFFLAAHEILDQEPPNQPPE